MYLCLFVNLSANLNTSGSCAYIIKIEYETYYKVGNSHDDQCYKYSFENLFGSSESVFLFAKEHEIECEDNKS